MTEMVSNSVYPKNGNYNIIILCADDSIFPLLFVLGIFKVVLYLSLFGLPGLSCVRH